METVFNYSADIENKNNKIILGLLAVVFICFIFLSYKTDTLGKFIEGSSSPATSLYLLDDSYGGMCSPNSNYGQDSKIVVIKDSRGCKSGPLAGDKQAYLKFDISDLPSSFESAKLFLRVDDVQKGSFELYPIKLSWDELGVRWNGPSDNSYWRGAGLSQKDIDPEIVVNFNVNSVDELVEIDATEIVEYWARKGNNGLVIKAVSGSLVFYSKESGYAAFIVVK